MLSREPSLRILHVLRSPVGGLFRHVLDLAREQSARGHVVGMIARIAPLLGSASHNRARESVGKKPRRDGVFEAAAAVPGKRGGVPRGTIDGRAGEPAERKVGAEPLHRPPFGTNEIKACGGITRDSRSGASDGRPVPEQSNGNSATKAHGASFAIARIEPGGWPPQAHAPMSTSLKKLPRPLIRPAHSVSPHRMEEKR